MARRIPNLRKLATRQRRIIWLILASIAGLFVPFAPLGNAQAAGIVYLVVQLLLALLLIINVGLLMSAQGSNPVVTVLACLFMVVPLISLLVLLRVNGTATQTLKAAGIRVGFMGASKAEVERILAPGVCKKCGYSLEGNTSGRCPECGTAIKPAFCGNCGFRVADWPEGPCPQCGLVVQPLVA